MVSAEKSFTLNEKPIFEQMVTFLCCFSCCVKEVLGKKKKKKILALNVWPLITFAKTHRRGEGDTGKAETDRRGGGGSEIEKEDLG